ncbi:E3 ubiquitin-protein ligase [Dirofilaria immitis]
MLKDEAKSDQNIHDKDEIENMLTNGGSIYEDDNCSGKVEQVQSVNVITSQMQSDRKQLAEGEQNVNQEGSTHFIRFQESVNVDVPNSPKTISDSSKSEKRACRICQSETGELVRPCACTGTMGDIHERCLNEWLLRSNNNDRCEICQEKYSKSGNILQPIWKWQKPQIEMTNIVEISSVICLSLCLWYMITLTIEREFFNRIFIAGLPPRSPDVARILVTFLIISTLIGGLMNIAMRIWHYINKQRAIRFIDSDINKKSIK